MTITIVSSFLISAGFDITVYQYKKNVLYFFYNISQKNLKEERHVYNYNYNLFSKYINIVNFSNILHFPSSFLCSCRIFFIFHSKFNSFKLPVFCENFHPKENFFQSGSAAEYPHLR